MYKNNDLLYVSTIQPLSSIGGLRLLQCPYLLFAKAGYSALIQHRRIATVYQQQRRFGRVGLFSPYPA